MDPQNYQPQPPVQQPPTQNPYDYILNTPQKQKKSLFNGGSQKSKIILSIAFVVGVLVLVIIAINVFQSLSKKDYTSYTDLQKKQATILHVADLSYAKLRTTAARNYVTIIRSTTTTEKADTTSFLAKVGVKTNDKKLSVAVDTSKDKAITAAEQTNQYDDTVVKILGDLVADYQKDVVLTAKEAETKAEKTLTNKLLVNARVVANVKADK